MPSPLGKVAGVSLTEEVWIPDYLIIFHTNKKPQIAHRGNLRCKKARFHSKIHSISAITGGFRCAISCALPCGWYHL